MSGAAIALLLLSAGIHVGWNLTTKRRASGAAFFALASLFLAAALTPLLLVYHQRAWSFPGMFWVWVAATGVFEALYYTALANAYQHGEMAVTYPLARALPVLMLTAVNLLLGRGEQLSVLALAGMALIFAGCLLLPLADPAKPRLKDFLSAATLLALLAATGTAGYSLVDDQALRLLRSLERSAFTPLEAALVYSFWQNLSTAVVLLFFCLRSQESRQALRRAVRSEAGSALWTGLGIFTAYLLVLVAMAYARNISYVVAFRQTSIPLGALAGVVLLKEKPGWVKLGMVGVIFAGLVMVAIG